MSDYIKREDAIKSIKPMVGIWADDGRFYVDYQRVLDIINNELSADVVEVVHAYDKEIYPSLFECSNCGWSCEDTYGGEPCNRNSNTYDYCPNCGARIEYKVKEQEHE